MRFDQPVDHARRTEDALRFINRYWRGSGVPRRERQDRLAELRLHLEEATADGRDVEDVTGPDLAAFAAEWMQADRARPWLDITLRLIMVLAVVTGLTALLGPGPGRYAIASEALPVLAVAGAGVLVADVTRMYRSRLNTRVTALLYLGGVVVGGGGGWLRHGPAARARAGGGAVRRSRARLARCGQWRHRLVDAPHRPHTGVRFTPGRGFRRAGRAEAAAGER